ncbi:hypothetical protein U91I_01994 [alpha proteobacterium U9-1i]|nr:hypothetical protein U91I_01994 [alpha proteobacterium U9-1i]
MFDLALDRRGESGGARGEILIGDHRETFLVDLSYWDFDEYRASWLRSAAHVLEHGYGRFLVSVSIPGQLLYITWVVRTRAGEARLHKSFLLPDYTRDFIQPEEAETPLEDFATRDQDESADIHVFRCALRDIADFETRLRGAAVN